MTHGSARFRLDSSGNTHIQRGSAWNARPSAPPASPI